MIINIVDKIMMIIIYHGDNYLSYNNNANYYYLGAVQRWIHSKPVKAAISAECEGMAGMVMTARKHHELELARYAIHNISSNILRNCSVIKFGT